MALYDPAAKGVADFATTWEAVATELQGLFDVGAIDATDAALSPGWDGNSQNLSREWAGAPNSISKMSAVRKAEGFLTKNPLFLTRTLPLE